MPSAVLPESHILSLRKIEEGHFWFMGRINWAKKLISKWNTLNQINYADLGSGTGGFALQLNDYFFPTKTLLVDGDENALSKIGKSKHPFNAIQLDMRQKFSLPFQPNLITCMDVIEHLEDDEGFLKNVFENLEKKGLLILTVPSHPFLFSEWDRKLGHFRRYTKKDLMMKIKNAGFRLNRLMPMWSFLTPMALTRKWKTKKFNESMQMDEVSPFINRLLIISSQVEFQFAQSISLPFGTSWILSAEKP